MSGFYLHSPQEPCGKDCCPVSPCKNKGEKVVIRGKHVLACVHNVDSHSPKVPTPKKLVVKFYENPTKVIPTHGEECLRRGISLPCPFGRCELKCDDIFKHFFNDHYFIRVGLDVPLYYRLKHITRDMFIIYQSQNDVFFVGHIEDSYQKNVYFEIYVVYNYPKKCCGYPKFAYTVPGVVKNRSIEFYRSKHAVGKSSRRVEISKDKMKKYAGTKIFYDLEIVISLLN